MSTYEHDCDDCVFLGTIELPKAPVHDLYYCDQGGKIPTVIARFGDRGDMYASGMGFANGQDISLTVAKTLAVKRGLIDTK